jgi:hypothetical protein
MQLKPVAPSSLIPIINLRVTTGGEIKGKEIKRCVVREADIKKGNKGRRDEGKRDVVWGDEGKRDVVWGDEGVGSEGNSILSLGTN